REIAERRELTDLLALERAPRFERRLEPLSRCIEHPREPAAPELDQRRLGAGEVVLLLRILIEREERRLRRLEEERATVGNRAQRVPLVGEEGQEALGVA